MRVVGLRQVKFPLILDMKEYCTEEYQAKISAWREKVRRIPALALGGLAERADRPAEV